MKPGGVRDLTFYKQFLEDLRSAKMPSPSPRP